MILVSHGAEPQKLSLVRTAQLQKLRLLQRPPESHDIEGYKIVANELWKSQHFKCCYCELRVQQSYNDVEHYRPKAKADRRPGCTLEHGYWWLAFNWKNLLFSCPSCNRSAKRIRFPLEIGSISLLPESSALGQEKPLLIDPSGDINPIQHIQFFFESIGQVKGPKQWRARPRNNSNYGAITIEVCDLNRDELLDLRAIHFETVIEPQIREMKAALNSGSLVEIKKEFKRSLGLTSPKCSFAAFSYDALKSSISDSELMIINEQWPVPELAGR